MDGSVLLTCSAHVQDRGPSATVEGVTHALGRGGEVEVFRPTQLRTPAATVDTTKGQTSYNYQDYNPETCIRETYNTQEDLGKWEGFPL